VRPLQWGLAVRVETHVDRAPARCGIWTRVVLSPLRGSPSPRGLRRGLHSAAASRPASNFSPVIAELPSSNGERRAPPAGLGETPVPPSHLLQRRGYHSVTFETCRA